MPFALRCSSSAVPKGVGHAVPPDDHVSFPGLQGFVEVGAVRSEPEHLVLEGELKRWPRSEATAITEPAQVRESTLLHKSISFCT
jgi:hypothetical protein